MLGKDFGDTNGLKPAIVVPAGAVHLAHALKQRRDGVQYSVFGSNVKRPFLGYDPDETINILIRMDNPAAVPGEETVIDYIGVLDHVWADPPEKQTKDPFFELFSEQFSASWEEIKAGAGKVKEGPFALFYGVKRIRYLRSPMRVSEIRQWSDGQRFRPNYKIRRPVKVVWEPEWTLDSNPG